MYESALALLDGIECLLEVGDDVFGGFRSDGEADEIRLDSGFEQLLVGKLAVRMAGGVQHAGSGVRHMGDDGGQFQAVDELDGAFTASLDAEGDHTAGLTVTELPLAQFMEGAGRQAGVIDPGDIGLLFQELGHFLCILAMARDAEVEGFQSDIEQE